MVPGPATFSHTWEFVRDAHSWASSSSYCLRNSKGKSNNLGFNKPSSDSDAPYKEAFGQPMVSSVSEYKIQVTDMQVIISLLDTNLLDTNKSRSLFRF